MAETSPARGTARSGQPSLRERTRAAMRAEVSDVAFRLFAQQGYDNTTVEQIAAEAGLSRTTFFRYFGTKEDVVLGRLGEVGHQIAAALTGRPAHERPWDSLRRAFEVITQTDPDQPGQSLNLIRLLNDACALTTYQWQKTQGWQSILVPEITRRIGNDPASDLRARALVASAIACLNAAIDTWTTSDGTTPLSALLDQAMSTLSELST
jgi:AcrR family transcriptional regulator